MVDAFNTGKRFVCKLSVDEMKGIVESSEEISLFNQAEFVKVFVIWGTGCMRVMEVKQR